MFKKIIINFQKLQNCWVVKALIRYTLFVKFRVASRVSRISGSIFQGKLIMLCLLSIRSSLFLFFVARLDNEARVLIR